MRAIAAIVLAVAGCSAEGARVGDDRAAAPASDRSEPAAAPTAAPAPALGSATAPVAAAPGAAAARSPYARDLDRICNARAYAQADQPGVNPALVTAQWLGANLETDDARSFLARWNGVAEADRATALDAEAARVGLTACPTAREWDGK